jgi:methylmalonyl-CoA mutase cobalamin-binding subunit
MATAKDVSQLLSDLHDKKIVNLDTSLKSVLASPGLDSLDPGAKVGAAVVAWDGYAVVIKGSIASIGEIAAVGREIKGQTGATW